MERVREKPVMYNSHFKNLRKQKKTRKKTPKKYSDDGKKTQKRQNQKTPVIMTQKINEELKKQN